MSKGLVLLVEDDPTQRETMVDLLDTRGYDTVEASTYGTAHDLLRERPIDLVITDLVLPGMSGMDLLAAVRKERPETAVIMVTGHATVETAIEAMKQGAYDYLTKPLDTKRFQALVEKAMESANLRKEKEVLTQSLERRISLGQLTSKSPSMQKVIQSAMMVAATNANILITGESGTGKEVLADAIHQASPRTGKPIIKVNCAALPAGLLESELFGHEKGSFTGAVAKRAGRFEQATTGTLFLDEIGEVPLETQVKLLRVLQERVIERVGSEKSIKVDIRLIAATNQNLDELVRRGTFREDLYYRLRVIQLHLPPLRERREDLPILVGHFAREIAARNSRPTPTITPELMNAFLEYHWPGNIRQLRNCLEEMIILAPDSTLTPSQLPEYVRAMPSADSAPIAGRPIADLEKEAILATLNLYQGDKVKAADVLGIGLKTLYRKLKQYESE